MPGENGTTTDAALSDKFKNQKFCKTLDLGDAIEDAYRQRAMAIFLLHAIRTGVEVSAECGTF